MPKLRSDSFAARLTAAQREELFAMLAGGKSLAEAARWVRGLGAKAPSQQALSAWFAGARIERRFAAAKEAALVAQANCPADVDEQTRRALGQARFLATLEALSPKDLVALESVEIARQKLDIDRERLDLDRERLKLAQLDAAKAALAAVKELRAIASDSTASDAEKLERARQRLFGDGAAVPTLADLDRRKTGGAKP